MRRKTLFYNANMLVFKLSRAKKYKDLQTGLMSTRKQRAA